MLVAVLMAVSLVVVTFLIHYVALRWMSSGMAHIPMRPDMRIFVIVLMALATHLVEIGVYALAYGLGENVFALGSFSGRAVTGSLDYLYFSIVSYTSLGLGDISPTEHLRFITGVEALNGLLLIAWSGSFTYMAMGRLWTWQTCVEPDPR
uniref:ion channel n=1 Tax=Pararhizobium sp. IMCC3301 TaxID=3067904 RepID=UPI002740A8A1|nr:ion channel [Pararhizobium sp. IMCC3301]